MNNYNQNDFSNYTILDSKQANTSGAVAKKFMASVFLWMFVALGVSTLLAYLFATVPSLSGQLYVQTEKGLGMTGVGMALAFAPLAFVLLMSFGYSRLSAPALTVLFLVFAAVMGMSLSSIFLRYSPTSIIGCFGASSVMFGVMAFMGYTTDKDLTSFGRLLTMGLIGILIASLINMFLGSSMLGYLISIIGVAVFTGLTAYDVQKLKRIGAGLEFENVSVNDTTKLAIVGALNLYLDFINLFLMLLRLFGDRRN